VGAGIFFLKLTMQMLCLLVAPRKGVAGKENIDWPWGYCSPNAQPRMIRRCVKAVRLLKKPEYWKLQGQAQNC